MTEVRKVIKFEAGSNPLISALVMPAFAGGFAFLALMGSEVHSHGFSRHAILVAFGVAVPVFMVAGVYYLVLQAFDIHTMEISEKNNLLCFSLFRTTTVPIDELVRLTIGLPDEMMSPYRGAIETSDVRLTTCQLGEFAFARLGFFFRYLSSLNPQMALKENIDFLAPHPIE